MSESVHEQETGRRWLLPLAIFLLAVAVFSPSIGAGFVLDDEAQVLKNSAVRELDLGAIFSRGYWENVDRAGVRIGAGGELYRPLTTLSAALSFQLWGESPTGYHAENILFHALAAVLVLLLLQHGWRLSRTTALFAAALFAVAPIHIEPVASIILRNELLAAIFGLLFLLGMARGWLLTAALCLLGSLLCKESAIALPLVAMAADRVFPSSKGIVRSAWLRRYAPALIACAAYFALRAGVIGQLTLAEDETYFGADTSWPVVWLTMARFGVEHYLSGSLFGTPLWFDVSRESFADASTGDPLAWTCLLFWLATGVGSVIWMIRARSVTAFGCVLFLLLLGPTANVVTRIGVLGATRLMYLPYLGIALMLGHLLGQWAVRRGGPGRRGALLLGCAVLLALVIQTERKLLVFRRPLFLYEEIVAEAPRNALVLGWLAEEEFRIGRTVAGEAAEPAPPADREAVPSDEWYSRAFDHMATSLLIEPEYSGRFARSMGRAAILLGREDAFLIAMARALSALGKLPSTLPAEPDRSEWGARPLTAAEVSLLEQWAAEFRAVRLTPDELALLAREQPGILHPFYQRELLFQISRLVADRTLVRSARETLDQLGARLSAGSLGESERRMFRELLDRVIPAQERLKAAAEEAYKRHPDPLMRALAKEIYARDTIGQCALLLPRYRGWREGL